MYNNHCYRMGFLCFSFFIFLSVLNQSTFAQSDAEIESSIESILLERHPTDTPEWWRALGQEAPRVILKMIEKNTETYRRLRLVEALAWFSGDSHTVEFLKQEAERTQDDVIRNAAIKGVGISQGTKEIDFISKYLKHSDPQTRYSAALALRGMEDVRARAVLDEYLKEEKASWIVDKVKNKPIVPTKKLVIVSSSEERASDEFSGTWRGYFVFPKKSLNGMKSVSTLLRLQVKSATNLVGDFSLTIPKKALIKIRPSEMTAKAKKISGTFLGEIGANIDLGLRIGPEIVGKKIEYSGELWDHRGTQLLRIEVPKVGGTFFLRRD